MSIRPFPNGHHFIATVSGARIQSTRPIAVLGLVSFENISINCTFLIMREISFYAHGKGKFGILSID